MNQTPTQRPVEQTPLKQVKDYLRANFEKGCICPACDQNVKLYPRKLNSGMSYGLILFYKLHTEKGFDTWLKFIDYMVDLKINAPNLEYPKLAYWGLIEEKLNAKDPTKRSSGLWRITQKGIQFATNKIGISSHANVFNNKVHTFSDKTVFINDTIKSKFNYEELMSSTIN